MSVARYPAYVASAEEWIGEIPAHWPEPPLYSRYEVLLGKMLDEKRQTGTVALPYVRNVNVQWDHVDVTDLPQMDVALHERDRFTLRRGDLLVCEGGDIGRTATWNDELEVCAFQKALHRLRPLTDDENPRFLYYTMRAASDAGVFLARGNPNTIPHLTGEALRVYRFPKPARDEQDSVVVFLDRETAKIDALVEEQRRLIALLGEKRQAVISHMVTKGLDPDVPMRSSGVEWLGDMPAHWELSSIGRLAEHIGSGKTPLGGSETYVDEGILFLRSQNVYDDGLRLEDVAHIKSEVDAGMAGSRVRPGDILLNITGASLGRSCAAPPDLHAANVNQHVCIVRAADRSCAPFLGLYMRSEYAKQWWDFAQTGAAREGLNQSQIARTPVPLPPEKEQRAIVEAVEELASASSAVMRDVTASVSLLLERRSALITAAVTGQIDVRALAPTDAP